MDTIQKKELDKYLQLKIKVVKALCHINFLNQCKKFKTIPKFMKVRFAVKNKITNKVDKVIKRIWLKEEIKNKYSLVSKLELETYYTHLKITKNYYLDSVKFNCLWLEFDSYVHRRVLKTQKKLNQIHRKKIQQLKNDCYRNSGERVPIIDNFVHNMSSTDFTANEMKLLNRGLNFASKPAVAPLEDIVVDIESGTTNCSPLIKNNIRFEAQKIILQNNVRKNNKASSALKTIAGLKKKKDVVFLKADKGNAVVILDKLDYDDRVLSTISDGPYKEHTWRNNNPRDPLNNMVKQAKSVAKEIAALLDDRQLEYKFHVTNPKVSKLYALPKIHKPGNKMRPIASNISTPTENMAKWLLNELRDIPPPEGCSILNSKELVEKLGDITLAPDEILVSFDVTALFPSIPIKTAIDNLEDHLLKHRVPANRIKAYIKIVNACMEQNFVQFRNKFYQQTSGTSMGSKLAPYLSNIFMSNMEEKLKQNFPLFPRVWLRYVDDIFAIVEKQSLSTIFNHINTIDRAIKFTMETEENGILNFLDIKIIRDTNNKLKFGIFRKSTNTNRFITVDSFHHVTHKEAAFHSMAHRLFNIPMEQSEFDEEVKFIQNAAIANGYSKMFADKIINKHKAKHIKSSLTTFKPTMETVNKRVSVPYFPEITNKLQRVFRKHNIELVTRPSTTIKRDLNNYKDKVAQDLRSGIYQIKCSNCQETYIGQTSRDFNTRLKEHEKASSNKSSVAYHMFHQNHKIDNTTSKIIKPVYQKWKLDAFESYYIANTANLMNTDDAKIISPLFKISF